MPIWTATVFAQEQTNSDFYAPPSLRPFQLVLPSGNLFGAWGGLRTNLENAGLEPNLTFVNEFLGNPVGGRSQGVTAPSTLGLDVSFDLDKIAGLKDASLFVNGSERWGRGLSKDYIGNVFAVQSIFGFETYRLIDVAYLQKLFDDRVEFRVGRFSTADDFMYSAYNYGFVSGAFNAIPVGIFFDAPGMTVYTGTWAAMAKVKPTERSYVMTGVYNGDPSIREDPHHGVDFSLHGPVFTMSEVGYQINGLPGDNQLLGNYKAGFWHDNSVLTNFETGIPVRGSWGYYGMFDQALVAYGKPGSNRGFGIFGSTTVAVNPDIQQLPIFLTAGCSSRGHFESRPEDAWSLGIAYGHFSEGLQNAQREAQQLNPAAGVQNHETVIELTYRFSFRKGALFIQPDFQYIFRPGGTGQIENALVLGAQVGIHF